MNVDLVVNYINQFKSMKCDEFEVALLAYDAMGLSAKEFSKMPNEQKELMCDAILAISKRYESKYNMELQEDLEHLL